MESKSKIASPPSFLFPLGAGVVAFFIGEKSFWAGLAGVLAGALFNEAAKNSALKLHIAHVKGWEQFQNNFGAEALSAILGTPDDPSFTTLPAPQHLSSGNIEHAVGLDTIVGQRNVRRPPYR